MRSVAQLVVVVPAFVMVAVGCPPPNDSDLTPPRVITIDPAETVVPVTASFRLTFSEAINPKTVSGDVTADNLTVVLATSDKVSDAFLSDVKNPPLTESRQNDVVPVIVALTTADTAVTVQPREPLLPGTAYTLILSADMRDTAGNPLANASGNKDNFVYAFTTDAGPPKVSSTDLPTGASLVVPNRKRFTVTFNQPVQNVSQNTLRIDGSPAAVVEAILVDPTRTTATVLLADPAPGGGCGRLGLNGAYTLAATADIVGDTGQALEAFSQAFTTGGACDSSPNTMSGVEHVDGEVNATVRFTTTKPSTTEVRFGISGAALDCLGGPCPVVGAPTTGANGLHTVAISGLTVNVGYDFVASAEDEVGNVATAGGHIQTAPLPKVSVNEMLADTATGHDDDTGEFIELASFEPDVTTDLSGWKLRVTHGTSVSNCALPSPGPQLAPGGFLVVAKTTFDGTIYGSVDEASIVRLGSTCSLTNGEELLVELLDPTDRPVSTMAAPASKEGRSVERIAPDAVDTADSYCFSRTDTGPTPGRQNGVVAAGCE